MSTLLTFKNLRNTRDLGGMVTSDGRKVKCGKLIRSGQLVYAGPEDQTALSGMLGEIVDFRTDQEIYEKPDPYFPGVSYHHIPILNSWTAGVTWTGTEDLSEEELFMRLQKEPDLAKDYMQGIYKSFAANEHYIRQYRKFVDVLLKGNDKAILWHCTAGKDRAGFASVIVEELLGIDRETIKNDYLMTSVYLKEEIEEITANLRKKYPEPGAVSEEAMDYLFGAKEEFFDALYERIEAQYSTFEVFIKDALKVTKEERRALFDRYLEEG